MAEGLIYAKGGETILKPRLHDAHSHHSPHSGNIAAQDSPIANQSAHLQRRLSFSSRPDEHNRVLSILGSARAPSTPTAPNTLRGARLTPIAPAQAAVLTTLPQSTDEPIATCRDRKIFDSLACARAPLLGGMHEQAYRLAMLLEALHARVEQGVDQSQLSAFEHDADNILAQILTANNNGTITPDQSNTLMRDVSMLQRLAHQ